MNKEHAADREDVLVINADREYREGKAQNSKGRSGTRLSQGTIA
jgi:hypothetical protein